MTRDISPDVQRVRLLLTEPHTCSYLPDQKATTAFVDPQQPVDARLYSRLSTLGFRRSGKYLYIPRCDSCSACLSARIRVDTFKPNRQQRRCLNKNRELRVSTKQQIDTCEHYPLYQSYIANRHNDGDMFPPTIQQYNDFINSLMPISRINEFRLRGKLVAASVLDRLDDGLSAIYTYFSENHGERSLGTYAILVAIEQARKLHLPYVYLGYWIKDCNKMSYKSRFDSLEILVSGKWIMFNRQGA